MSLFVPSMGSPEPPRKPVTEQLPEWVELKPEMIESMERLLDYWQVRLLDYWKLRLLGATNLELPTDKPRPIEQSYRGEIRPFSLSPDLAEALKALSRHEGVTFFMTLVAAFQVLLHRYSGQDDIVIGTPTFGRNRLELEGSIGFFINTLALRTDLSGNPGFRELLGQVREVTVGAYANQDIPFEKLVEALHPQRDFSRNPLFQVMFVFQNIPDSSLQLQGTTPELLQVSNGTTQFDLTLELTETAQGLAGRVEYATDLFEAATIERLIGHFRTLLEGIIAQPDARLSELPLLTEAERRQLLVDWNDTAAWFPRDKCIHELFEAQAAATPQALAVVCGQDRLTYAELNAEANRLAHHLGELGVRPDALVAICVERNVKMVVGLLAILKAGGAYVPLDPAYPQERLAFMLDDSSPVALLTQGRLEGLFREAAVAVPVIDLDAEFPPWASRPDSNPASREEGLSPRHLAYMIYTSGSTGKPKGVMVEHRNVVHSTTARFSHYREQVSAYLLLSSFAFDSSVAGLFWTLGQGGCLYLPADDIAKDPIALADLIANRRVSHLLALPSFYALLLKQAGTKLHKLKTVIVAGETCSTEVVKQHYAVLPDVPLYNEYGPTECSIWSSVYLVSQDDLNRSLSIGRPISNARLYILDGTGNPLPIGIPGELYIGGEGVVRGYWNRPELTAERFVADPFTDETEARMYKTGDLARWRADGAIEFLGRNDFQVKIRGFRIELGDIEAKLSEHLAVREASVLAHEDSDGAKRLVAYLVLKDYLSISVFELRDFLKKKLPDFMVPSVFIFLNALPILPNGKLDRKAFPKPDIDRQALNHGFVAPRSPVEEQLVEIWSEILKIDRIGIYDNFFELGGQSLLAMQVIIRVGEQLSVDIPINTLFEMPTITELAKLIENTGARNSNRSKRITAQRRSAYRINNS